MELLATSRTITDEGYYIGYHLAWTQKAQGVVRYDSTYHLEDSRRP
jgi:hypothetical protein